MCESPCLFLFFPDKNFCVSTLSCPETHTYNKKINKILKKIAAEDTKTTKKSEFNWR